MNLNTIQNHTAGCCDYYTAKDGDLIK